MSRTLMYEFAKRYLQPNQLIHFLKNQMQVLKSAKVMYEVVPSESEVELERLSRGDHIKVRKIDGKEDHAIVTKIDKTSGTLNFIQCTCDGNDTAAKDAEIIEKTVNFNEVKNVCRFDYREHGRNNLIPDFTRMPIEVSARVAQFYKDHPADFQPGLKKDCEKFAFCCTIGYPYSSHQMKLLIIAFGTLKMFDKKCFTEMKIDIDSDRVVTFNKAKHEVTISPQSGQPSIFSDWEKN